MSKFTHVKCKNDVIEEGVLIFKKGEFYKIVGFDYKSLVYYIQPEFYEDNLLPDEFIISPLDSNFEFLALE
ncbi:hypothetical protein [Bacillus marasmi]|uniref:hypothetical protein n=1 Tax=Bacillus marasmi TaxID=1926279 RepID=UPI0011CA930D|nr:hypothetical protein [Bacillus marasmi]